MGADGRSPRGGRSHERQVTWWARSGVGRPGTSPGCRCISSMAVEAVKTRYSGRHLLSKTLSYRFVQMAKVGLETLLQNARFQALSRLHPLLAVQNPVQLAFPRAPLVISATRPNQCRANSPSPMVAAAAGRWLLRCQQMTAAPLPACSWRTHNRGGMQVESGPTDQQPARIQFAGGAFSRTSPIRPEQVPDTEPEFHQCHHLRVSRPAVLRNRHSWRPLWQRNSACTDSTRCSPRGSATR